MIIFFFFRYNIGFIIFYVLGTCLLLPWYFFITANDVIFFFNYKFHFYIYLLNFIDYIFISSIGCINYEHYQKVIKSIYS